MKLTRDNTIQNMLGYKSTLPATDFTAGVQQILQRQQRYKNTVLVISAVVACLVALVILRFAGAPIWRPLLNFMQHSPILLTIALIAAVFSFALIPKEKI